MGFKLLSSFDEDLYDLLCGLSLHVTQNLHVHYHARSQVDCAVLLPTLLRVLRIPHGRIRSSNQHQRSLTLIQLMGSLFIAPYED
jgi:hypothetical protein